MAVVWPVLIAVIFFGKEALFTIYVARNRHDRFQPQLVDRAGSVRRQTHPLASDGFPGRRGLARHRHDVAGSGGPRPGRNSSGVEYAIDTAVGKVQGSNFALTIDVP